MQDLLEYLKNIKNKIPDSTQCMENGSSYFFSLLKRLTSCGSKYALINNGLIISIYDINDDNDENGFNHMFIPNDGGYFYNQSKKIDVKSLYEKMRDDDREVEDYRKSKKIKPSMKTDTVELTNKGFDVTYALEGIKYKTYHYELSEPDIAFANEISKVISNMFNMYTDKSVIIEENYDELVGIFETCPRTHMSEVEINHKKVNYPFMKSFLFGLNKPDMLYSCVNEVDVGKYSDAGLASIIGEIYGYTIIVLKNKTLELHCSYIVNYIN